MAKETKKAKMASASDLRATGEASASDLRATGEASGSGTFRKESSQAVGEVQEPKGLGISAKSFITSLLIIFGLMVGCYVLTLVVPAGEFARVIDENGNSVIDRDGGFSLTDGGLPFWKWLLSPFLVLGSNSGSTIIVICLFLLIIGGVFNALQKSGVMNYMLELLVARFGAKRYRLMGILIFFFMAMGSLLGSFEEVVPFVPICVALAVSLGWDRPVGVSISLLAAGCGFAAGVCNPFSVGVAQELAGLPMFSGIWMRLVAFVLIYGLLFLFTYRYAKRVERPVCGGQGAEFRVIPYMSRALKTFALILGSGLVLVLCSPFIPGLQDLTMIIVAVMFLVAGLVAVSIARLRGKRLLAVFGNGTVSLLPSVLLILMASSIKYTLEEGKILDSLLNGVVSVAAEFPTWTIILVIYFIVLAMNFFVPSGSAKAFMLMPLIVPMAQIFDVPVQLCVLAYAFGDGFSNVFYPTNPALLISLGLGNVSYTEWAKWSWKFQLANLVLTCGLLLFGFAVGYC